MRKLTWFALLSALVALSFVPFRPAPGPGAIEDMLKSFFKAFDTGDRDTARACLVDRDASFPVLIYDLDLQNKPVAIEGLDASRKYLDAIFDAVKQGNVKVASKITKIHADCHSPELGYATLEYSQTFTADGKSETSEYRATVLVSWGKDQNKGPHIFHWHASLAKEPVKEPAKPVSEKKQ